ncbi:TPD1 protein homolog 1B-like [Rutidosis leptorrhynchoides]|uniref:TPD1 protein homolog 1B-like n=1 Tax=Rutidosis leptorrhynchoides TaxID=125765 RepID=UPI003A994A51
MGSAFECFLTIFLFTLLAVKGDAQACDFKDMSIETQKTNRQVKGKPEWDVKVQNNCALNCSQYNVVVSCNNFQSVEKIDPDLFRSAGDNIYLVAGGGYFGPHAQVVFSYAWDSAFDIKPYSSKIRCPGFMGSDD